jgi:hypothetical protein
MNFDLIRPCDNCPFRTDCLKGWLGEGRAAEIAVGITDGQKTFTCHKTTKFDDELESVPHDQQQHCAGAMILLEKLNRPNQMMRWMERLGMYDRSKLDMDAPVFDDTESFIEHHTKESKGAKHK